MIVNNRFYRLDPANGTDPAAICESPVLTAPPDLIAKIKRLDGLVIATWDPDTEQGKVCALGVVEQVDGRSAVVDWRRANFTLRPSRQGATQWRKRPFFKFADLVATRYGLMGYFHDAFDANASRVQPAVAESPSQVAAPVGNPRPTAPASATTVSKPSGPQCNRVAPNGEIFATTERGLFMGNRTSPPRWLICDLHFKRDLKEPRKYTRLFFLDEAVALAAGHRPCNTCRREQYGAYRAAVNREIGIRGAGDLDAKLNAARKGGRPRTAVASLPDGAFVELADGDYRLKWSGALHRWTPGGYVDAASPADLGIEQATVLTPGPTLAALRNSYPVVVHASAM